jgi:nitrite reductase (NADH) small subunit
MERWETVCQLEDIPRLGARRLERAGLLPIALFRGSGDTVHALVDRCPHKGGPLSQGIVFERGVACPLHNWTIVFSDGCAAAPDAGCTPRVAVRRVGDAVQLNLAPAELAAKDGGPS